MSHASAGRSRGSSTDSTPVPPHPHSLPLRAGQGQAGSGCKGREARRSLETGRPRPTNLTPSGSGLEQAQSWGSPPCTPSAKEGGFVLLGRRRASICTLSSWPRCRDQRGRAGPGEAAAQGRDGGRRDRAPAAPGRSAGGRRRWVRRGGRPGAPCFRVLSGFADLGAEGSELARGRVKTDSRGNLKAVELRTCGAAPPPPRTQGSPAAPCPEPSRAHWGAVRRGQGPPFNLAAGAGLAGPRGPAVSPAPSPPSRPRTPRLGPRPLEAP